MEMVNEVDDLKNTVNNLGKIQRLGKKVQIFQKEYFV